jgi:large subunit ribosomal protein L15
MFKLDERVAVVKKRKRVGRGGSRGGTSGRGHKGQKSRSGAGRKLSCAFEGGQMPLHRRLPKRGFTNARFKVVHELVKLSELEQFFDNEQTVTKEDLVNKGLLKSIKSSVKVLSNGEITKKLTITVDACSASALEKIKSCGGAVAFIKGA